MGRKSRNTFSAQFPFPTSSGPLGSNRPAFSISIPPGGGAAAHLYGSLTTCRGNHDSFCIPQAAGVASSSSSSYSSNSSGCGNKTGSIKIKTVCRPTGLEDNKTKWQFTILFTSCRQQEENLVVWVNSSTQESYTVHIAQIHLRRWLGEFRKERELQKEPAAQTKICHAHCAEKPPTSSASPPFALSIPSEMVV